MKYNQLIGALLEKKLPLSIEYKGDEYWATTYLGTEKKTKKKVKEYRTEDDAKRIWVRKDGSFFED